MRVYAVVSLTGEEFFPNKEDAIEDAKIQTACKPGNKKKKKKRRPLRSNAGSWGKSTNAGRR